MENKPAKSNKLVSYLKKHFLWQDIIVGLLLLIVVGYFFSFIIENPMSSGSSNNPTVTVAAKKVVTDNLKSPSSAKFSDISITDKSNGNYRVTGYVEAQNSFGAVVKSSFSLDLNIKSDKSFTYSNLRIN